MLATKASCLFENTVLWCAILSNGLKPNDMRWEAKAVLFMVPAGIDVQVYCTIIDVIQRHSLCCRWVTLKIQNVILNQLTTQMIQAQYSDYWLPSIVTAAALTPPRLNQQDWRALLLHKGVFWQIWTCTSVMLPGSFVRFMFKIKEDSLLQLQSDESVQRFKTHSYINSVFITLL